MWKLEVGKRRDKKSYPRSERSVPRKKLISRARVRLKGDTFTTSLGWESMLVCEALHRASLLLGRSLGPVLQGPFPPLKGKKAVFLSWLICFWGKSTSVVVVN